MRDYARHPEAKAADADGKPAGPYTIGLLYRLPVQSKRLIRIGKEVDRLAGDEGATLTPESPVEYSSTSSRMISTTSLRFHRRRQRGTLA